MLIDTHCHLDFPEFDHDREEVIKRAKDSGVNYCVNIGSSIKGSERSVELASAFEEIYATVGVHPHEADNIPEDAEALLRRLAGNKKVVAIGEIGLDYFRHFSKKENQIPLFSMQLKLAKELNLPLVIHTRDAREDTLKMLKQALPVKAVVHCFSGDLDFLRQCLDLGFLISFTCNITYPKAENLREVLRYVPLDSLFLETDAPYLSPEGFRGKRNEPAQVRLLAQSVSEIKGKSFEDVASCTTKNARRFFNF